MSSTQTQNPAPPKLLMQIRHTLRAKRHSYNTIEVIVEKSDWEANGESKRIPKNKIVFVRVNFGEKTLGITVKAAGGTWNKQKKL